jgi:predicted lipoprotein with Yx(FWY)xxD motif
MHRLLIGVAALAGAAPRAACGGSSSSSTTAASSGSAGAAGQTVSVKSISGLGDVLVDGSGMPLYSSNLDTAAQPACTGACAAVWKPLTVASGAPTVASNAGKVALVKRADGTQQVAIDGKPLYTFVNDAPGQVTGNGAADSFAGRDFTWSAVLAGGKTASGGGSSPKPAYGGGY